MMGKPHLCGAVRVSALVFALAAVPVAGCGRSPARPPATAPTPPMTDATAASTGSAQASPVNPPVTSFTSRKTIISWLKEFTPTGGGGSPQEVAYTWFMKGDCATTLSIAKATDFDQTAEPMKEPHRGLFEGAAAACLAAFHGRTDLWPTAAARLPAISPSVLNCWDREVYTVFKVIVQAHEKDPGTRFERGRAPAHSNCPELDALEPDHGPKAGGYTVRVTGRNLPATLKLYWFSAEREITARRGPDGVMTVVVPPPRAGSSSLAILKIVGAYRTEQVYAKFRYDDCVNEVC
jgi:hypothetical protein